MKHAARVMIPRGKGSIISLASVASVIGGMGPHGYTGSKHAVVGLTKSVAAELGKHGIRVNCVSPYAVPTDLSMSHLPESERTEDATKDFVAFVGSHANLKGVDLRVDDVAEAVLFLASDEARYVSGLNLTVDGGFSAVNNELKPFEVWIRLCSCINASYCWGFFFSWGRMVHVWNKRNRAFLL
jgi:NAD(P)-dependent dehydrogenase (short-subunit alcohol dehydrogenase family)